MPRSTRRETKCTRCGGEVKRVHRSSEEARHSSDWRRYRCTEEGCDWEGLLPRTSSRSTKSRERTKVEPRAGMGRVWLVMGGLLLMAVLMAGALLQLAFQTDPMPGNPGLSGATHSSSPPAAPALQPRR